MHRKIMLNCAWGLLARRSFVTGWWIVVAIFVALSVSAVCPAPVLAGGDASAAFQALPAEAVQPDADFNQLFTRTNGGWTGGDGTYSVPLPDGRTVWIFGDSFLGRVNPDRTRPNNSPLINNCFVIQVGNALQTLHGGTAGKPRALVEPSDGTGFYWPGDGSVEKNRLRVLFNRFVRTGSGPWQWQWLDTDIISFSLPELAQISALHLEADNGVMYGSAVLADADHVYVYGTKDLRQLKKVHVARFPAGAFTNQWQYFAGRRWSNDAAMSVGLLAGASNQFSVLKVARRYLLITTDSRLPFHSSIVVYASTSPTGPWSPGVMLYDPPETGEGVIAYNALAHPQFSENGWLLVSYNLNHVADDTAVYRNADLYRPRFIRVNLKAVINSLPEP